MVTLLAFSFFGGSKPSAPKKVVSTPKPAPKKIDPAPAPVAKIETMPQDPVTDAFSSFFGSKKAEKKEPEPQEIVSVPAPTPVKKAEPFSFFGNVLPKGTLNIGAVQPKKKAEPVPAPAPVSKKPEPFSFLPKGTLNIGAVQPKKKAEPVPAPAPVAKKPEPFSFFGSAKKPEPKPVPAPAPVAKKPEPFSFFGSGKKPEPKPVPAPAPVAKKPAPFSFFGSAKKPEADTSKKVQVPKSLPRGTINLKKVQPKKVPTPTPKKSFFGGAAAKKTVPAPAPTPAPASKTFSIFGGGAKKTSAAKAATVKKTSPLPRGTISLKQVEKKTAVKTANIAPKDNIPVLKNWEQNADGSITGNITNSKVFRNNQKITTSSVRRGAKAGSLVTTSSGSKYRLS